MQEGFLEQREYEDLVHLETLHLLRINGYTTLNTMQLKKGKRHPSMTKWLPLRGDKEEKSSLTPDVINELAKRRDSFISNGKLRGYEDSDGNLWNQKKGGNMIGYINNGEIEYIN